MVEHAAQTAATFRSSRSFWMVSCGRAVSMCDAILLALSLGSFPAAAKSSTERKPASASAFRTPTVRPC